MFKAIPSESGYEIIKLSSKLNTKNGEGDPFISPEEDYIIFRGYNNSLGNGDLYISYFINDEWTEPDNLGEPINSKYHEICPNVTVDGKFFIFSSSRLKQDYTSDKSIDIENIRLKHKTSDNGELNIYYISSDFIKEGRAKYIKGK
jgi:Tol biopolymer transport system component